MSVILLAHGDPGGAGVTLHGPVHGLHVRLDVCFLCELLVTQRALVLGALVRLFVQVQPVFAHVGFATVAGVRHVFAV